MIQLTNIPARAYWTITLLIIVPISLLIVSLAWLLFSYSIFLYKADKAEINTPYGGISAEINNVIDKTQEIVNKTEITNNKLLEAKIDLLNILNSLPNSQLNEKYLSASSKITAEKPNASNQTTLSIEHLKNQISAINTIQNDEFESINSSLGNLKAKLQK